MTIEALNLREAARTMFEHDVDASRKSREAELQASVDRLKSALTRNRLGEFVNENDIVVSYRDIEDVRKGGERAWLYTPIVSTEIDGIRLRAIYMVSQRRGWNAETQVYLGNHERRLPENQRETEEVWATFVGLPGLHTALEGGVAAQVQRKLDETPKPQPPSHADLAWELISAVATVDVDGETLSSASIGKAIVHALLEVADAAGYQR